MTPTESCQLVHCPQCVSQRTTPTPHSPSYTLPPFFHFKQSLLVYRFGGNSPGRKTHKDFASNRPLHDRGSWSSNRQRLPSIPFFFSTNHSPVLKCTRNTYLWVPSPGCSGVKSSKAVPCCASLRRHLPTRPPACSHHPSPLVRPTPIPTDGSNFMINYIGVRGKQTRRGGGSTPNQPSFSFVGWLKLFSPPFASFVHANLSLTLPLTQSLSDSIFFFSARCSHCQILFIPPSSLLKR